MSKSNIKIGFKIYLRRSLALLCSEIYPNLKRADVYYLFNCSEDICVRPNSGLDMAIILYSTSILLHFKYIR